MSTFNDNYSANVATLGTLGQVTDGKAPAMMIPFYVVVPSSPGTAPVFNLGVTIPKGFKPTCLIALTNGLSISAAVGLTVTFGDSGDASRLAAAQDFDQAASFIGLDPKGYDYEYTADTQLTASCLTGKTPVTGQKMFGCLIGRMRAGT